MDIVRHATILTRFINSCHDKLLHNLDVLLSNYLSRLKIRFVTSRILSKANVCVIY